MQKAFPHFRVMHLAVILALLLSALPVSAPVQAAGSGSPNIVISQVYGGGGATSGTPSYKYDYVELFNRSASAQSIAGWSIQYGSAAGNFGSAYTFPAGTSIDSGKYLLIQTSSTTASTVGPDLTPAADLTTTSLNLSGTNGKVVLANVAGALGCGGSTSLCNLSTDTRIVDLVAYGTGTNAEGGTAVGTLSTTSAAVRNSGGCVDTDTNSLDFTVVTNPVPRNSSTAQHLCTDPLPPFGLGSAAPNLLLGGETTLLTVTAAAGSNPTSSALSASANLSTIGGSAAQAFVDDGSLGDVSAGDNVFSFEITIPAAQAAGTYTLPFTVSDGEGRSSTGSISLIVTAQPLVAINAIQGSSHVSPYAGQTVMTQGVVTAIRPTGFYIQTPMGTGDTYGDNNDATSEGLFIYSATYKSSVAIGDIARVLGPIADYGSASYPDDLKVTQMSGPTGFSILSHGNPLPNPIVIGVGGRVPPNQAFYTGTTQVNVEDPSYTPDPVHNGIDFYEPMEGMRVEIHDAVATGPTEVYSDNSDLAVVIDNGLNASPFTPSGGLYASASDYNPERILLNDLTAAARLPQVNVGAKLGPQAIVGVMDYSFSSYKLEVTTTVTEQTPSAITKTVVPGVETPVELSAATFNVENLAANNAVDKFNNLAAVVVNNLKSPDVLAIEEIQDNNGATDDGTVTAGTTWTNLIDAITRANGPTYSYRQIDPVNDSDGGQTGGNIRQGFLFRTDRGLSFVDRGSATSTTANTVYQDVNTGEAHLTYSPGRIDPTNSAFTSSRKPLAGEFMFRGQTFFIIANHFNSKGGDSPLFGRMQPPVLSSETQRLQQATVVSDFVKSILAVEPSANVMVLGDLNDFPYSPPITRLKGTVADGNHLNLLIDDLPVNQQYTYNYGGNAQAIDHTLVSDNLKNQVISYTLAHVNAEFAVKVSDHDPQVTVLAVESAPILDVHGPYSVAEGGSVQLTATATDPEGDAVFYDWDLNNDGTFETYGSTVTFNAGTLDGGSGKSFTVKVKAMDQYGDSTTTKDVVIAITNTAPSATGLSSSASPVKIYQPVTITINGADDPSEADKASLHYAFDCDGTDLSTVTYAGSSTTPSKTCTFSDGGTTQNISAVVLDQDGGRSSLMRINVDVAVPNHIYLPVVTRTK